MWSSWYKRLCEEDGYWDDQDLAARVFLTQAWLNRLTARPSSVMRPKTSRLSSWTLSFSYPCSAADHCNQKSSAVFRWFSLEIRFRRSTRQVSDGMRSRLISTSGSALCLIPGAEPESSSATGSYGSITGLTRGSLDSAILSSSFAPLFSAPATSGPRKRGG